MDDPEHGRSSSSQSVKIDSLSRRKGGRPGEEISVTLSDASSFFVSLRVWEDRPFHEGDELELSVWEEILSRSDSHRAYGVALSLLARSEHSRFLLQQKLELRGLSRETCGPVLDELEAGGQLSDMRYAASWVRSRLSSHPEGRSHLIGGLRQRGIGESTAANAVDDVLQDLDLSMADVARRYVDRLTRRKTLSSDKIASQLYRRGFSGDAVRRALSADFSEE